MLKTPYPRFRYILVYVTGYLAVLATLVVQMLNVSTSSNRWITMGLVLTFGVLMIIPKISSLDRRHLHKTPELPAHLYLAIQGTLVTLLLALGIELSHEDASSMYPLLFCILSLQAVLMLPLRAAVLWIAGFTLVTNGLFCQVKGISAGLIISLPYTIGFIFSGIFAYTLSHAEAAQHKSSTLLQELQVTHRQLQEYALQIRELAVAEERNRLAREMHDAVGHRLTVAAVQLEGAQRLIPTEPERAAEMIGTVREQTLEALSELRQTVSTLRAPLATDLSLPATLARLTSNFEEATGLTVHQSLPPDIPALPDAYWLGLYRVAQEALTNIQRHAQATQAWLTLTLDNGAATLTVQDDGVGFPAQAMQAGFGLRGLHERAVQLGGSLILDASPTGGAQVSFHLPLPMNEEAGHDPKD